MSLVLAVLFSTVLDLTRAHELAAELQMMQTARGRIVLAAVDPAKFTDSFGTPYRVSVEGATYRITGAGANRTFDDADDVVLENGKLVQPTRDALTGASASELSSLLSAERHLAAMAKPQYAHAAAARATMATIERVAREIAEGKINVTADDAWGNPLLIDVDADGSRVRIISAGADRVIDESSWSRPMELDPAADLVYEKGAFKRKLDVERYLRERGE